MHVLCVDEAGFEDQLTEGQTYPVALIGNGGSSYQVENDQGDRRWYGEAKFEVVVI